MKNNSNIYDIDGKLIRDIEDTDNMSVENAEQLMNEYQDKLKQLSENEKDSYKAGVYKTYIQNLQRYILNYYIEHPEEAKKRISTEAQIQKAMEELKADVEKGTVMDEYVEPIEEIKDEHEV